MKLQEIAQEKILNHKMFFENIIQYIIEQSKEYVDSEFKTCNSN